ncbi:MAG: phosphoglycerate kinase [Candidatus Spechtbacterales bacterium]
MKKLKDIDIKPGTRVLLRADFNVAMDKGNIEDDFRMRATLPTINYLRERGARVLILAHLGRPKDGYEEPLSLMPIAEHLGTLLSADIKFFEEIEIAEQELPKMENGEVAVLENLRFDKREEEGSEEFAKELAALGDVYVNDAFGVIHREHASVYALAKLLPHSAGLLVEKEVDILSTIRKEPAKPLVFVMGGSKVETKIKTLYKLFGSIDDVCLGGLMSNSIMKLKGMEIGKSMYDKGIDLVYIDGMNLNDEKIHLPLDVVVSTDASGKNSVRVTDIEHIEKDEMILDAGPRTIELFSQIIKKAGTVVWNGPLGLIEVDKFAEGTRGLAQAILKTEAKVVVGGGDVMRIIDEVGAVDKIHHASTGGGAMLEYLAEGTLPALEVLK